MAHLFHAWRGRGSLDEDTATRIQEPGALKPPILTATNRPLCWSYRTFGSKGKAAGSPGPVPRVDQKDSSETLSRGAPPLLSNTPNSLFRMLTRWLGPAAPIVSGGIRS